MRFTHLPFVLVCFGFTLSEPCHAELIHYEVSGIIRNSQGSTYFAPNAGVGSTFRANVQFDTSQGSTNPIQGGQRTIYQNGFQVQSYHAGNYNLTFDSLGNLGRLEVSNNISLSSGVTDSIRGTQVFIVDPERPSTIEATLTLTDSNGTALSTPVFPPEIDLSTFRNLPTFSLNYFDYSNPLFTEIQTLVGRIAFMNRITPGGPLSVPILNGDFGQGLDGFQVSGPGTANVIDYGGNSVLQMTTGSPVVLSQMVNTPENFTFSFDYLFQTVTGNLDVLLNGVTLDSIAAPSTLVNGFSTHTITVTDPSLFNLTNVELAFLFDGPSGSQVLIDNLSPLSGTAAGAVTNAVPEPTSLALLGIGSLGLIALRRRTGL